MSDTITLTGIVATTPRHLVTSEGLAITSFRLATSQRRFDRQQSKWLEYATNWYTVSCYRVVAVNAAASIDKGDRILLTGTQRIKEWTKAEQTGTTVEIDATTIGHDLGWGTTSFTRSASPAIQPEPTTDSSFEPADAWAHDTSTSTDAQPAVAPEDTLIHRYERAAHLSLVTVGR